MRTSEHIDQLITALAQARPAFTSITRNRTVKVSTAKGSYDFAYATLDHILEAVTPALSAQGLAVVSGMDEGENTLHVITRLAHSSGQWIETAVRVGSPERLQELGSALTYGRRYGISAILGIQADDDDDGNLMEGHSIQPKAKRLVKPERLISPEEAALLMEKSQQDYPPPPDPLKQLFDVVKAGGWTEKDLREEMQARYKLTRFRDLTGEQIKKLHDFFADAHALKSGKYREETQAKGGENGTPESS